MTDQFDFDDLSARPGYLVRRLHQIHVGMFLEECAEHKLTPLQYAVLTVLRGGMALDQVTVANQIGVDRNTAADVIRRLESNGLLDRPGNDQDKRTKLARITQAGLEVVESMQPQMIKAQRRLVSPLTNEEYQVFMRLMEKIVTVNNEASRAPLRPKRKSGAPRKAGRTGQSGFETSTGCSVPDQVS